MGRGQNRNAGHNHVLAAIADAIYAGSSYKSKGKGKNGKDGGSKGQYSQWGGQDGRNCPSCNDYNFGFRTVCRQCGAWLPPPRVANSADKGQKATGKAPGTAGWNGAGKGPPADSSHGPGAHTGGAAPTAAAAKPTTGAEQDEGQDPAERIRDIRSEEEKLRRSRSQYADINPRLVSAIDEELAKLASEREKIQPLEVNLQAAAGRTANARAALSKAREKRALAAKELREYMERYKTADREVGEAEARLSAAEAAATAKRTDAKSPTVQQAMEVLQQTAASKCADSTVAAQVSAALQRIADILGAVTTPTGAATNDGTGDGAEGAVSGATPPQPAGSTTGDNVGEKGKGGPHPVFAVCGATENKSRRTVAGQRNPSAYSGPAEPGEHGQREDRADASQPELFAGGAVDGEVTMGAGKDDADPNDNLLSQAAGLLVDDDNGDI